MGSARASGSGWSSVSPSLVVRHRLCAWRLVRGTPGKDIVDSKEDSMNQLEQHRRAVLS